MAVTRAAHGILGDIELRRKRTGDAVKFAASGGCRVQQKSVKRLDLHAIGSERAHLLLVFQNTQQVTTHDRLYGSHADSVGHGVRYLHGPEVVSGEVHLVKLALAHDGELTA